MFPAVSFIEPCLSCYGWELRRALGASPRLVVMWGGRGLYHCASTSCFPRLTYGALVALHYRLGDYHLLAHRGFLVWRFLLCGLDGLAAWLVVPLFPPVGCFGVTLGAGLWQRYLYGQLPFVGLKSRFRYTTFPCGKLCTLALSAPINFATGNYSHTFLIS